MPVSVIPQELDGFVMSLFLAIVIMYDSENADGLLPKNVHFKRRESLHDIFRVSK